MLQYTSNLYLHHSNPLNLHNLYTFTSLSFSLWHQAPFIHRSPNLQGFNTTRKPTTPTRRERNGACTCVLIRCKQRERRTSNGASPSIYIRAYIRTLLQREERSYCETLRVMTQASCVYTRDVARGRSAYERGIVASSSERKRKRDGEKPIVYRGRMHTPRLLG